MSFFGVTNPFTTAVGQRIEHATDPNLKSENWALNMEICDIINDTEDGPRDAIKAIKRRLNQAASKNYTIVLYTLTVLETCVKNCDKRFHALACSRDFIQELVKLIGPKNEPPTAVQEKVLSLIQTWADTFKSQPHTQGVVQIYQELKSKGIDFPVTDLDAMAPIITPERSVPESEPTGAAAMPPPQRMRSTEAACARQPIQLTEQQMLKLRSELDTVHGNMRVFSEMLAAHSGPTGLQEATSEKALAEDLELLTELNNTCKAMQERIVDLIGKLAHDELTAELLQINDEMNNLFLRYNRFTKNRGVVPASALVAQALGGTNSAAAAKKKIEAGESLIDLSDEEDGAAAAALPIDSLDKRVGAIGLDCADSKSRRKDEADEFEAFAQSRTTTGDVKNRRDRREGEDDTDLSKQDSKNSYVTSPEFERFLAERTAAAVAEVSGANGGGTGGSVLGSSTGAIQRQVDKN